MQSFDRILARAAKRKGGPAAVEKELPTPRSRAALSRTKDARILAGLSQAVFRAGFVWRVVEAKWPGFEEAFDGFAPAAVASMSDSALDALADDTRVIRNRVKLESVRHNARLLLELADEHGSAARFIARWPEPDIVGLWEVLKKRGSRLGGNTGPFFLRFHGKDTFMLSDAVVRALVREKVLERPKAPSSKKALAGVQAAFNAWAEESGRPLCQISRVLAMSVD